MAETTGSGENVLEGKVNFHLDDGDGVNLDLLVFERNITITYDLTSGAFISVEVSGNIAQANISTTVYTDSTLSLYTDPTFASVFASPEYFIGDFTNAQLQLDAVSDFDLSLSRVRYSLSTDINDASQVIRDIPLVDITTVHTEGGLIQFTYTTPRVVGCTPCNLHVETTLAPITAKRGLLARDETPNAATSTQSVTVREEASPPSHDNSVGTDDVSSGSSSVAVIAAASAGVAVAAVLVAFFANRRRATSGMVNAVNVAPSNPDDAQSPLIRTPGGGLRRKRSLGVSKQKSFHELEDNSVLPGGSNV